MKKFLFIFFLLLPGVPAFAQEDSVGVRQEGWPELNLYYRFNERLRLFALYSVTKLRTSNYTDGGVGIYMDYFVRSSLRHALFSRPADSTLGYYLWLRGGYYFSVTPPGAKEKIAENTIITEANSHFHLPLDILFTTKNRFDWRFVNDVFEPRYRLRLNVQKDLRTDYLYYTPYLYGEYFANFTQSSANRFRVCLGFDVKIAANANLDTYFLYQFQNDKTVDAVNAIGLKLKFFFHHQEVKEALRLKKKKKVEKAEKAAEAEKAGNPKA